MHYFVIFSNNGSVVILLNHLIMHTIVYYHHRMIIGCYGNGNSQRHTDSEITYKLNVNKHETYYLHNSTYVVILDFSLTVKAAPHECVIRTSPP